MKKRNPDFAYDNDEEFMGAISKEFSDMDTEMDGLNGNVRALTDMFNADPRSAAFLTAWKNGDDPVVAMIHMFGQDMVERLDDPDIADQVSEANKAYLDRIRTSQELDKEYTTNLQQTLADIESLQSEEGISDDEIDNVMAYLKQIVNDGILGKFSKETILMAMKAINHDADVETANREGEVRGRNTKITEKLRKGSKGDGVGMIEGRNNGRSTKTREPEDIFQLAAEAY